MDVNRTFGSPSLVVLLAADWPHQAVKCVVEAGASASWTRQGLLFSALPAESGRLARNRALDEGARLLPRSPKHTSKRKAPRWETGRLKADGDVLGELSLWKVRLRPGAKECRVNQWQRIG